MNYPAYSIMQYHVQPIIMGHEYDSEKFNVCSAESQLKMSFFNKKTVTGCAAKDPCASDGAE